MATWLGETNSCFWCDFDRASSLICGNKMPTRCNRGFLQIKTSVASSWHFISTNSCFVYNKHMLCLTGCNLTRKPGIHDFKIPERYMMKLYFSKSEILHISCAHHHGLIFILWKNLKQRNKNYVKIEFKI